MSTYLEDIIAADLTDSPIRKTAVNLPRDSVLVRVASHPVATSTAMFYVAYQTTQDPTISLIAGYGAYTSLGLIKEYLVEGRKILLRKLSDIFLNNPKLVALISTAAAGLTSYYSMLNMPDAIRGNELAVAVANGASAGILTESVIRWLKNAKRLRNSTRRLKISRKERFWNLICEHPLVWSSIYFAYSFYSDYHTRTAYKIYHPGSGNLSGNLLEDLIQHPDTVTSIASSSGTETALVLGSLLLASSVLHTHSLRELGLRIKKTKHRLFGETKEVIGCQERIIALPNSTERTLEDIVELGNLHYESRERELAFRYYRRALRLFSKKQDHLSYADFFRRTFKLDKLRRSLKRRKSPASEEEKAINLMFIDLLNKDPSALQHIKELSERDHDPRLLYLYGKALEIIGYVESGRQQKLKAIDRIIESGDLDLETISGSKNTVVLFDDELLREEVIAKASTQSALEREIQVTNRVRECLTDFDKYDVPVPIGLREYNGRIYYVMEQANGELLADRIRQGRVTIAELISIASFMGLIHAKVKSDSISERDYRETIRTRLTEINIPTQVVEKIDGNIETILYPIKRIARVCNKDAHPRNWCIDEYGGIIALDMEMDRVVPLTFDTANLIDQYDGLTEGEKDKVFSRHIRSFRENTPSQPFMGTYEYKLAYLNSVIIRALEIYSQVRTQNREVMVASLNNAQKAIRRIEEDYFEYYNPCVDSYEEMYEAIDQLKAA